ncbi:MAG: hypothetical protein GOU98_03550 [Candidatus Altiarchaeota archaeon]|nr:hypothetical protein [Candidatus Altiarchaeota archaeon]
MVSETTPVTSLKKLKDEIDTLKRQIKPVDAQLLLRLLDYVESREKLTKNLLIHMNAVEGHIVRVTELLQKLPQVNIGLLADSLQAQIPKLDEIAYNTRKMVDYLELAAGVEPEDKPKEEKKAKKKEESTEESSEEEKTESGKKEGKDDSNSKLGKIEEQNKALINALGNISENLDKMGSK